MEEKIYQTEKGEIHYWHSVVNEDSPTLVFLPGLTADHRLFDPQIPYFSQKYNVIVWDAPGHAASRPFELDFILEDKARWLDEILQKEEVRFPILIGQSMGGYVVQMYTELYPEKLKGAVIIDSAPLQKQYTTRAETWALQHMTNVYRYIPWDFLEQAGTEGVAETEYGRKLMLEMMKTYEGDQDYYARLSGHGFRMLADAIESDRQFAFRCPVLLLCGREDKAGSAVRHNRNWQKKGGHRLIWIERAGHNSNTDRPELVNKLIDDFINKSVLAGKQTY